MMIDVGTRVTAQAVASADGHDALINQLEEQRGQVVAGGGQQRVDAQHAKGKLTARERIGLLLDAGSFHEIGTFITHRHRDFGMDGQHCPGDGMITGFGKIEGRRVALFAQDFTVLCTSAPPRVSWSTTSPVTDLITWGPVMKMWLVPRVMMTKSVSAGE